MRLITEEVSRKLGDDIHAWHAALDRGQDEIARFESTLSDEEKARADRFHFENDRSRFVVARGFLRALLGEYLQRSPATLEFSYGQHGKPALAGPEDSTGLSFNVSHSSSLAVYAISRNRNLGIDVEHVRPESVGENIAERYFSTREFSELRKLPPEAKARGFFNCWTRKEAYLKATGLGLRIPLGSFAVSLAPGQPAQFLEGVESCWQLSAYEPAEGYAAAIVHDGGLTSIQYFPFDSPSS